MTGEASELSCTGTDAPVDRDLRAHHREAARAPLHRGRLRVRRRRLVPPRLVHRRQHRRHPPKVTNDLLRELVVWDENGRLFFAEGYSYTRGAPLGLQAGAPHEVRQLNERGLELFEEDGGVAMRSPSRSCSRRGTATRPASPSWCSPSRPVQWARPDDAPMYKPTRGSRCRRGAEDVAFDMSGSFESGGGQSQGGQALTPTSAPKRACRVRFGQALFRAGRKGRAILAHRNGTRMLIENQQRM